MAKILAYEIKDYRFPFKRELKLISQTLTTRDGCFLKLCLDDGSSKVVELAPFPTVHKESLSEARKQLEEIMEKHLEEDLRLLESYILNEALMPSVSFCISQLFEDKLFTADENFIPTNSTLIQLDSIDIDYTKNCSFKIKLGRDSFTREYEKLEMIHQRLPADKLLRLDPNQSLDIEQVSAIIDLLGSQRIEYLEEPFSNVDDCKKIKAAYPNISIALDESLWDVEPKNIPDFCDVIIMKPTRFHSLHSIKDFIGQAKKTVVLSSCYESARCLKTYQKICSFFSLSCDMGFGSYEWIEDLAYEKFSKSDYVLPKNSFFS